MEKLLDINGNEFKVGCVFGLKCDSDKREVLKIYDDGVFTAKCGDRDASVFWASSSLLHNKARILRYRALAPGKNDKMINQYDKTNKGVALDCIEGNFILKLSGLSGLMWETPDRVEFVSRPTDTNTEIESIRKEVADAEAHLKAAQEKLSKVEKR